MECVCGEKVFVNLFQLTSFEIRCTNYSCLRKPRVMRHDKEEAEEAWENLIKKIRK